MEIQVTQEDIDNAEPSVSERNCVSLAIKRIKKRDDVWCFPYVGSIRIGERRYVLDDYAAPRLILQMNHYKIEPFTFELPKTWTKAR